MSLQAEDAVEPKSYVARPANAATGWGYAEISTSVLRHYDPRTVAAHPLRVLEAGGGSNNWLPLPVGADITTIDISAEQLAKNSYAREKLLGDLQTFDYGARHYDLIIAWDVLEHLERPEAAVTRLVATLAPGGRLIVKGPLARSLKGLVTRYTPHALHVAFYRHILGSEHAGKPGYAPFKAYLAYGSDAHDLARMFATQGLAVDAVETFESAHVTAIANKSRLLLWAYRAGEALVAAASLGHYKRGATDFYVIARRPA
jgi:SAM-dependent methyltransferase